MLRAQRSFLVASLRQCKYYERFGPYKNVYIIILTLLFAHEHVDFRPAPF